MRVAKPLNNRKTRKTRLYIAKIVRVAKLKLSDNNIIKYLYIAKIVRVAKPLDNLIAK